MTRPKPKRLTEADYLELGLPVPRQFRHPEAFDLEELYPVDRGRMTIKRILNDVERCEECGDDIGACGCDL